MKIIRVFCWLFVSLLILTPISFAAVSETDLLLNLLIEKGVVTNEDAAVFRAELAIKKQEEADLAAKIQEQKEKEKQKDGGK